jgi:hypothetical protein
VQQDGGGHGLDQRIDDFSLMSQALQWAGYARDFLYQLPLLEVEPNLTQAQAADGETYVLAQPGEVYAIYNDTCGRDFSLDLSDATGSFDVRWFDPRHGGPLQQSNVTTVTGGGLRLLGSAPSDTDRDWACLVQKTLNLEPARRQ